MGFIRNKLKGDDKIQKRAMQAHVPLASERQARYLYITGLV